MSLIHYEIKDKTVVLAIEYVFLIRRLFDHWFEQLQNSGKIALCEHVSASECMDSEAQENSGESRALYRECTPLTRVHVLHALLRRALMVCLLALYMV